MSRKEDFEKSAMDYCEDHSHCIYFEFGAEYGYQYAIQKVVNDENKAFTNGWDAAIEETIEFFDSISCCEWVEDIEVKELVKKYKKFMNE